jgi:hypothetical protein
MRTLVVTALAALAIMSADTRTGAQAQGRTIGAWCLFYDPYTYNCGFATLQQCRATAHGVGGRCQPSPGYVGDERQPRRKKRGRPKYD